MSRRTPLVDLPDTTENKKALTAIIEEKKKEKSAVALRKEAEVVIRPVADSLRSERCQSENKFYSSVKIKCGDIGPVTFVNQNRYSDITTEKEEELKEIFGEQYDKCFTTDTTVSLTEKGLKEAHTGGLLDKLVEACGGEEKFSELFSVEQKLKPTEFLHEQKILEPKLGEMVKKAAEAGLVQQASSSFSI